MGEPVEPAELAVERREQCLVLGRGRRLEVEGKDRGLRPARRHDVVIGAGELSLRAAEQGHRRALPREAE